MPAHKLCSQSRRATDGCWAGPHRQLQVEGPRLERQASLAQLSHPLPKLLIVQLANRPAVASDERIVRDGTRVADASKVFELRMRVQDGADGSAEGEVGVGDDPGIDEAAGRARRLAVVGLVRELLAPARPAGSRSGASAAKGKSSKRNPYVTWRWDEFGSG